MIKKISLVYSFTVYFMRCVCQFTIDVTFPLFLFNFSNLDFLFPILPTLLSIKKVTLYINYLRTETSLNILHQGNNFSSDVFV
jgi:hypothetical protein